LRIVLDFNSVLRDRHSGFFTYGVGLLEGFAALDDPPELTLFCGAKVRKNADWLGDLPNQLNATWKVVPIKMRALAAWWRAFGFPAMQRFVGNFDLYHCNHHLMGPTKGKPRLLTVHDLRRYRFPEFYPHSKLGPFEHAIRKADHYIAISQTTKRDLEEIFDIPPEKIDVVYHGGPRRIPEQTPDEPDHILDKFNLQANRYFVVFSSYDRRKNLTNTIRAFAADSHRLHQDFHLVIIGAMPKQQDIIPADLQDKLHDRLVFTGPLDRLETILGNATALVYVSLYEGFGLPILEAMAAGTAVITSNVSSMPEVAGTAALLVDPESVYDIAHAMTTLAEDISKQNQLVAAGRNRCREFSWSRAARETLEVYRKLLG
jgi:glycosyltransferase involved in cell wall biosynthesis